MRARATICVVALSLLQIVGLVQGLALPKRNYTQAQLNNPWISVRNAFSTKYTATQVWFEGRRAWCFRFNGDNNRLTASVESNAKTGVVVFPRYLNGTSAGFPIFSSIPTDADYSDAWSAKVVVVPSWLKPNKIRSFEKINSMGYQQAVVGVYNFALVPKGSRLFDARGAQLRTGIRNGWYKGNRVRYFDFGGIQIDALSALVPTTDMIVVRDSKFVKGSPIITSIPGQPGYTGFFSLKTMNVSDSTPADSFREAPPAGTPLKDEKIVVNCPVVLVESAKFDPTKPTPAASIDALPKPAIPPSRSSSYFTGPPGYFTTVPVFYQKKAVFCWPFGQWSSRTLNDLSAVRVNEVIHPVYESAFTVDAEPKPAGRPLIRYLPGHPLYSDAVARYYAYVSDDTPLDKFTTFEVAKASIKKIVFAGVFNQPVVPRNSAIVPGNSYKNAATQFEIPKLMEAWIKWVFYGDESNLRSGKIVNYFDAGAIVSATEPNYVIAAPAVYNSLGQTIVSTIAGDVVNYSGFYGVGTARKNETSLDFADYTTSNLRFNLGIFNCPIAAIA
ncbi:hypothetical protein HDU96_010521 [Phlyctochytrium bullatum]|nr:hypothetical protein HDU96_010521 [Phlyctochytrium bullatum]